MRGHAAACFLQHLAERVCLSCALQCPARSFAYSCKLATTISEHPDMRSLLGRGGDWGGVGARV